MKYYFKVWLFTILISPFFVVAGLVYQTSGNFSDFFKGLPIGLFAVLFSSAFSLPALFLFRLLNKDLAKHDIPVFLKKLIHAIIGILLLWITFYVMNREIFDELSWNNMVWPLTYSIILIIGAFIYKVKEKQILRKK